MNNTVSKRTDKEELKEIVKQLEHSSYEYRKAHQKHKARCVDTKFRTDAIDMLNGLNSVLISLTNPLSPPGFFLRGLNKITKSIHGAAKAIAVPICSQLDADRTLKHRKLIRDRVLENIAQAEYSRELICREAERYKSTCEKLKEKIRKIKTDNPRLYKYFRAQYEKSIRFQKYGTIRKPSQARANGIYQAFMN